MRLSAQQIELIRQTVQRTCGEGTGVVLFGSRLHDDQRGGDVDLLLEPASDLPVISRARLKMQLESGLGLPVDLLVSPRGLEPTPFQQIALLSGRRL
jgi:predicted nucleotidyltransferase